MADNSLSSKADEVDPFMDDNNKPVNPNQIHVDWTPEHENILVEWADKAMVFRWMHSKSYQHYNTLNMWFTIPVIVMSTLTGTANFAQDKIPEGVRGYYGMGVGAVNIFAGILTTVAQFLKISELNESHRVASLSWDKFYRNIKVELAKKPDERSPVMAMIKAYKEEFDRLAEISPSIEDKVISEFTTNFSDGLDKIKGKLPEASELSDKQKDYLALVKPEICNSMTSVSKSVYVPPPDAPDAGRKKQMLTSVALATKALQQKAFEERVAKCVKKFKEELGREPRVTEICNELQCEDRFKEVEHYVTECKRRGSVAEGDVNVVISNTQVPSDIP